MNILERIVEEKRAEVARRKRDVPPSDLADRELSGRAAVSLQGALRAAPVFGIIAEIKRASPSAGVIRDTAAPREIALAYARGGAAGISVLTDAAFFRGSLDDLLATRAAVALPLLRKDFIIDPYQVAEAKAHGADAILLIAAILERAQLAELHAAAAEAGLECLVELYDEKEIDILDTDKMTLIGINNRDLRTFEVRPDHAARLSRLLPSSVMVVSESGVSGPDDVRRLASQGIRAALVGEYCMRAPSPADALRELLEGAS
jgi:indole-3-glycerol phosphate synthase